AVDRIALDVLHDEVWQAIVGGPSVEQAGDVRMLEPGEDLPLTPEVPNDLLAVRPAHDLQRHALVELLVGARREEHRAHPAVTELTEQPVRADAPLDAGGPGLGSRGVIEPTAGDARILDGLLDGFV